jgi:signal transduction histidine kinase
MSEHLTQGAVPELARVLTEAAAGALEVERVGVWLFDKEETALINLDNYVLSTGEHSSGAVLKEQEYRDEFEALKKDKYVDADDPLTDPRTAGYVEGYLKQNRISAMLDAVIRRGGKHLGTLCFEHVDRPHHWEEDEIGFACQLADQVALAVSNREYRQVQEEKSRLEEQYRQAQKLEAIGRLAGGVAHDLNNLLTPIIGYCELLLDDLGSDDARRASVDEVLRAGFRARDLVRRLLAFSRKQTLEFKPVDINQTIEGFKKLLRRTIPEDIDIELVLSPDIRPVLADIGRIEQVLMNLAVNAADAMPEGGTLTIETALADLDEAYASKRPGVTPGRYVMLTVSDTGCGMDEATQENIFEPFFSTKGERGTGMGLATVYGIVKQHGGNIWVYSEPDKGTTFKIYLPLSEKAHLEDKTAPKTTDDLTGTETILLVEDDARVRDIAFAILNRYGYTVLVAENGKAALSIVDRHEAPVHLLLTDVVMPEMNGRDLFAKIAAKHPDLKVLYMSGYTNNVIAHRGILDEGVAFIQKPFTVNALGAKVREVLEK